MEHFYKLSAVVHPLLPINAHEGLAFAFTKSQPSELCKNVKLIMY